jgi:hypothetical protein
MTASDPDLRGAERVQEVFGRVRNGDDRVADLYAEDAVVLAGGRRIEGRAAIRVFYQQAIESIRPQPQVQVILESPPYYAALVEVPTTRGHLQALDLFQIGDDGIRQLEIYDRPESDFRW